MKFLSKLLIVFALIGMPALVSSVMAEEKSEPLNNVNKAPAKDLVLRGDAKCTVCHDEADSPQLLSIAKTKHGVKADGRTPTCTSCHGDSESHLGHKGGDKPPKPDRTFGKNTATPAAVRNEACLTCHNSDKRTHWEGSQHASNDVACTSCHKVHTGHDNVRDKKTQAEVCFTCHKNERADSHKMSVHPISAGKVTCSDCHNLHGSAGPKLLKKNTVNETCWTCHAEKRGPFLFEHQPVSESCLNCHTPHGSNITPLLKSRPPFMCQECHDGSHASGTPVGPNAAGYQGGLSPTTPAGAALYPSKNNVGNACMNCHNQVHGSNSPAGGFLQR
jgi:DmsE family decaheme c-type cytochrome